MKIFQVLLLITAFASITVVAQDPAAPTAGEGIRLYREGQFRQAADVLQAVVAANKKDYTSWLYLGGAYLYIGNEKEAKKAFASAMKGPKFLIGKTSRGDLDTWPALLSVPRAPLTQQSLQGPVFGSMMMAVEFRKDGTIGFVFPVSQLPGEQGEATLNSARQIRFRPGLLNGAAVTVVGLYEFSFN